MEQALVERAGIVYWGIHTGQLRGKGPLTALRSLGKMAMGVRQSRQIIDGFRPDVCLVTGGYVCVPVVIACRMAGVPVLIYLPDVTPGWAIRLLSRLAQRVAVSFPEAASWFGGVAPQGKAVVTGYPVRRELMEAAKSRAASRRDLAQRLGRPLDEADVPLLLVFGGSQGARAINQAVWKAREALLPLADVLHVVGQRDWQLWQEQMQAQPLTEIQAVRYHPVAYLHEEMPLALAAADLAVARSGASVLGEFTVAGLPSILSPLPGVNQHQNAELLERHGAAAIVANAALEQELEPALVGLLRDEGRRQAMARAALRMAQPEAAVSIGDELRKLAEAGPQHGTVRERA